MSTVILALLFAFAVLFLCWILLEYWLRDWRHQPGTGSRLRFGTRTAFALTHFWKTVDNAKDLAQETVKEDMAKIPRDYTRDKLQPSQTEYGGKKVSTGGCERNGKKYRIKENM